MKKVLFSLMLICFAFLGVVRAQDLSGTVTFDFEDQAIPEYFINESAYPWAVTADAPEGFGGNYCIMSTNQGQSSSSSTIEATFIFWEAGSISFNGGFWGEGTSTAWDKCIFKIDDEQQFAFGALQYWQEQTYEVEAGEHTFTWTYSKDSSVDPTGDTFYLDDIVVVLGEMPSCLPPTGLAVTLTPGNGSVAEFSWTENGDATSWQLCLNDDEDNLIDMDENPFIYDQFVAEETYTAKVRSYCDASSQSTWSNTVTFTPTNAYKFTVNEGTATNGYVPVYGYYVDGSIVSQFIIPASDLASIQWGIINTMTFYASQATVDWGAASFEVYMTEVDYTTFSSTDLVDWNTMDKVMNAGSLGITNNQMLVVLDAPYQYMGGNLLIGVKQISSGSWVTSTWYGVSATGASLGGNNAGYQQNFLPKTTFDYTPGEEPTCFKPTNLTATNIGTDCATLNWEGTSDSYRLQYRTAAHDNMNLWEQVGEDVIATGSLTQYTFDLSAYEGTGLIAIRHYNISDMFMLNVDDIVVTNANGEEVVNEDFENGSIPSAWATYDLDGDGYNWGIRSGGTVTGSYGATSASWVQAVGALTPDNWLIIPDVVLGGQLSFYAAGQDASFPQENFGVFVTTASLETVFGTTPAGEWSDAISTTETSYELTGLTPNTEYEWQVQGVCGEQDETLFASSSFTTIAEGFKTFITAGNWDVAENWFPAGVPTSEDEVSIEADAIIPAGVVAEAKRVDLTGGSITIQDGGQLKQGAATLRVTVEKTIEGYGDATTGKYYFISSPFSGRTLYNTSGTWSAVPNLLTGVYDLYAFDPANTGTDDEGETVSLEWVNYKANPNHISFVSDNGNEGLMFGEGYLYGSQETRTLQFVGTTGKSINYSEGFDYSFDETADYPFNGWKLVGNYFSCEAYITYTNGDGRPVEANFYTMNGAGTGFELSESSVALPVCAGAFINYSQAGTVVYSTEAPAKGTGMLNMTLIEGRNMVDMARVRFGEGFNLGKMSFDANSSKIYMPVNGSDYAVVYADAQGEMPVNFKAENNGTYTINFSTNDVEFGYLHLIDNLTGNDVDLLANPSYTFNASTSDYTSRFKLVFATGNANEGSEFAYMSDGNIIVNGEGTLQVIDMTGRVISTSQINGMSSVKLNAAAGVYVLQLTNGSDVKTQKIVVK